MIIKQSIPGPAEEDSLVVLAVIGIDIGTVTVVEAGRENQIWFKSIMSKNWIVRRLYS